MSALACRRHGEGALLFDDPHQLVLLLFRQRLEVGARDAEVHERRLVPGRGIRRAARESAAGARQLAVGLGRRVGKGGKGPPEELGRMEAGNLAELQDVLEPEVPGAQEGFAEVAEAEAELLFGFAKEIPRTENITFSRSRRRSISGSWVASRFSMAAFYSAMAVPARKGEKRPQ